MFVAHSPQHSSGKQGHMIFLKKSFGSKQFMWIKVMRNRVIAECLPMYFMIANPEFLLGAETISIFIPRACEIH